MLMPCECGCGESARAGNRFVIGHNARLLHDPDGMFWSHVPINSDMAACHEWTGNHNTAGYGVFSTGRRGNRRRYFAHRYSWEREYGPIPDGMFVCHRCDNPPCVNPSHLFLGTNLDNHRDMWAKGRGFRAVVTGERHYKSRVTVQQVLEIRRRVAQGETQRSLAKEFGLSTTGLHHIARGDSWKDIIAPVATAPLEEYSD
jgi:hypothetical protein